MAYEKDIAQAMKRIAAALGISGDFLVDFGYETIIRKIEDDERNKDRAFLMLNVAARYIRDNDLEEYEIFYDDAMCDGTCVADECEDAAMMLMPEKEG